jgi:hypothetical protein
LIRYLLKGISKGLCHEMGITSGRSEVLPNPSLKMDVQHAGAAPAAASRRLAPFR